MNFIAVLYNCRQHILRCREVGRTLLWLSFSIKEECHSIFPSLRCLLPDKLVFFFDAFTWKGFIWPWRLSTILLLLSGAPFSSYPPSLGEFRTDAFFTCKHEPEKLSSATSSSPRIWVTQWYNKPTPPAVSSTMSAETTWRSPRVIALVFSHRFWLVCPPCPIFSSIYRRVLILPLLWHCSIGTRPVKPCCPLRQFQESIFLFEVFFPRHICFDPRLVREFELTVSFRFVLPTFVFNQYLFIVGV